MKHGKLLKLFGKNGIKLVPHGKRHDIHYSPKTGKSFLCRVTQKRSQQEQ